MTFTAGFVYIARGIGGFGEGQGGNAPNSTFWLPSYHKGTEISFTETLTNFLLFYAL